MAPITLNIAWPIESCKCGEVRSVEHKPRGLFAVCPERRWWNFWRHDSEQLSWEEPDKRYLTIWKLSIDRTGLPYMLVLIITMNLGISANFWYESGSLPDLVVTMFSTWTMSGALGIILSEWVKEKYT